MEVMRELCCRGCGGNGRVVWREERWHDDVQPRREPLRADGTFFLVAAGQGHAVACSRCQQRQPHQV